jgi:hypothetical protein
MVGGRELAGTANPPRRVCCQEDSGKPEVTPRLYDSDATVRLESFCSRGSSETLQRRLAQLASILILAHEIPICIGRTKLSVKTSVFD